MNENPFESSTHLPSADPVIRLRSAPRVEFFLPALAVGMVFWLLRTSTTPVAAELVFGVGTLGAVCVGLGFALTRRFWVEASEIGVKWHTMVGEKTLRWEEIESMRFTRVSKLTGGNVVRAISFFDDAGKVLLQIGREMGPQVEKERVLNLALRSVAPDEDGEEKLDVEDWESAE